MKRNILVCDGCAKLHEHQGPPLPFTDTFVDGWGVLEAPEAVLHIDETHRGDQRRVDLCGDCLLSLRAWWKELAERP